MKIDLGGIAKGYTSSKVMDIFKENGISSAVISLGGNVQTLNGKPDGSDWRVAVENPADTGSYIGVLSIKDKAVITSGDMSVILSRMEKHIIILLIRLMDIRQIMV